MYLQFIRLDIRVWKFVVNSILQRELIQLRNLHVLKLVSYPSFSTDIKTPEPSNVIPLLRLPCISSKRKIP